MTDSEERAWDKVSELEDKIARCEAQIKQLTYLHNEDVNTIKLLNKQIEKMKCCCNCKHSRTEYEHCKTNKHEKWEIKNDL